MTDAAMVDPAMAHLAMTGAVIADPAPAEAGLESLLDRLEPLARRIGVTRVARLTHLDCLGFPVWAAIRPDSRGLSTSQGKGLSDLQARIGALMEAIEVWHAEQCCEGLVYESEHRLGAAAVPVRSLAALPRVHFDATEPQLWVRGRTLNSGAAVLLPWQAVSMNLLHTRESGQMLRNSNGLAGGRSLAAASLHALCELVERDAVCRWLAAPDALQPSRRLRLRGLPSPLAEAVAQAGRHCALGLWDIGQAATGLPCYACILLDPAGADLLRVGACSGYACDPDPARAALRALLEAAQARATMISGSRDDLGHAQFVRCRDAGLARGLREALAEPAGAVLAEPPAAIPADGSDEARCAALLDHLAARGIDRVHAVDLSRPELGVPVVKLLCPQLLYTGLTPAARARAAAP